MTLNLTCPVPTNINPLTSNGFNFNITKIPEVSFFCQEVNLPGISIQNVEVASPLSMIHLSGDMLNYDELSIQFLIDENMNNYKAIHDWIVGLGFPVDHTQFSRFIDGQSVGYTRLSKESSDATLQILNNTNNASQTIRFVDVFPTSLSSMLFQSTSTDTQYIVGNATFKIARYEFI